MDLEINVDFESEIVRIIVNNAIAVSAEKEPNGEILFKRFHRLESEELQEKLKEIVSILFSIEEEA